MSDDAPPPEQPKKKKGKRKLLLIGGLAVLLLGGGGAGAFYYFKGGDAAHGEAAKADLPQLVKKGAHKAPEKDGEGGHGGGEGGSKYAASYYQLEKEFTSNLRESPHFIQVGLAISTDYDERVIQNVQANELAVRSAVLMTLSDTDELQVFTPEGKKQLQKRLVASINGVLREKEGFGGIGNVYFTNFIVQ